MYYEQIPSELKTLIGRDEKILWYGKPDKFCFILKVIFSPFLLIAIVFSLPFLTFFINPGQLDGHGSFEIFFFFLLYLTPVWIYLFTCLTGFAEYRNTYYVVTDQAVYRSKGGASIKCEKAYLVRVKEINLKRGLFDKFKDRGTIKIDLDHDQISDVEITFNHHRLNARDFSIVGVYGAEPIYHMIKDAWTTAKKNSPFQKEYSYDLEMQIAKEKEIYQKEYFDSFNKKEEPILDKENLQAEYFKNLDNNNAVEYEVKYQRASSHSYDNVNYQVNKSIENSKNIKGFFTLIKVFAGISIIIFIFVFFVDFVVQKDVISKRSRPIHISFSIGSKGKINNTKSSEEVQKELISQDFESAKQLHLNKIISEVKNYKLREGITLEEKIKLLHPDIYDTFKWEASQAPVDMTYYFVTVSSPTNPNPYAQTLYRFNYNTVSYNVEATTSETNNIMTIPYQEPVKDNQ